MSTRVVLLMLLLTIGCNDFTNIDPPKTEIVSESVFTSDASAMSALRGIYSLMMTNVSFTKGGLEEYAGIASDEMISYATRPDLLQFYQNALTPQNSDVFSVFWKEAFRYINNTNAILEGLSHTTGMSESGMRQIKGEALFIRAYTYFHLTYLFGDVAYLTTTDYHTNASSPRNTQPEVIAAIEKDLLEAQQLLSDNFNFSNGERTQPNKGAAMALLARLYLYSQQWDKAEQFSSQLIDNKSTYALVAPNNVFLATSREAIWQLKPVVPGSNTPQGQLFILTTPPNPSSRRVSLRTSLVDAFETNDMRKISWIGAFSNTSGKWYFPHKYKIALGSTVTEYCMIFRLAEQYLIRAEARAQLDKIAAAQSDLNTIRTRANLPSTKANDKSSLLLAIEKERQVELFAEAGHRWFDLKRTNRIDAILASIKSGWQPTDAFFPIPQSERLLNPNLSQNGGY